MSTCSFEGMGSSQKNFGKWRATI